MNTQDVEVNDEIIKAIRTVCYFVKTLGFPTPSQFIIDEMKIASKWANDVIIGDDVPF